jgi:ribosomal protein L44E
MRGGLISIGDDEVVTFVTLLRRGDRASVFALSRSQMNDETKPSRVVDVPLACGNCGNSNWRDFRYKADDHDRDDRPGKLFGTCTNCGQSHVFQQSEWKMVGASGDTSMTSKFPMLITDLSEKERRWVEKRIKMLLAALRTCEVYLRDYAEGNQNVCKTLNTMGWAWADLAEVGKAVMKKHQIPDYPALRG